ESKSDISARNTFTWTTCSRSEPTEASIVRKESRIRVVCAATSGPASRPVAGSTPAVAPVVMKGPTLAMWLYGPIRARGVGGVDVSRAGISGSPHRLGRARRCYARPTSAISFARNALGGAPTHRLSRIVLTPLDPGDTSTSAGEPRTPGTCVLQEAHTWRVCS